MKLPHIPNSERPFDGNINAMLGYHVYGLFDPETGQFFYVGKAGGREGQGNARVFSHFQEARDRISEPNNSAKVTRIHEIWRRGEDVDWKILRSGLTTEAEAFAVEAALIDTLRLCGHHVLNDQGGHYSNRRGVLGRDNIYAWAAPDVNVEDIPIELCERPVLIFNIQNVVRRMRADGKQPDYVAATKRAWIISAKWRSKENAIAIGLVDGVSRAVFAIDGWKPDESLPKRWEMLPRPLPQELEAQLKEKNFSALLEPCKGYMQFGGFPILKFSENGREAVFLRGANVPKPSS
ncbi:MAG: GIY-YIG nuclease family protein [Loktanella sp.]|nr:GIY-YIG nuclease family protein [Loktanella sp.]